MEYSKKYLIKEMINKKEKVKREIEQVKKLKEKVHQMKQDHLDSPMIFNYLSRPNMKFKNKQLKKIVNIYQPTYKNHYCQGFGDYLRGSFFLLQFCLYNNIEFDMNYQTHNISKYIKNKSPLKYSIDHKNINYYHPDNIDKSSVKFYFEFIQFMNHTSTNTLCMFFNNIPVFKIGNRQRNIIKDKFIPTEEILKKTEENLKLLGLEKKKFSVLHLRCGDKYMSFQENPPKELINKIETILPKDKQSYLVIADNGGIKKYLTKYPNFKSLDINITHSAQNKDGVFDTIVDFFMMTQSVSIISCSPYLHGTGFSKYAAEIYDIPYKNFTIPV